MSRIGALWSDGGRGAAPSEHPAPTRFPPASRRGETRFLALLVLCVGAGTGHAQPLPEPSSGKGPELPPEAAPDAGARAMANLLDDAVEKLSEKRNEEALAKLQQKDYPAALNLLKQAHDLNPQSAEIANNLGYLYYLLGNFDEAEELLRATLKLDPSRFIAYVNLADLLGREGASEKRLAEASDVLKKVRELHGNKPAVILRQARVARLRERYPEAERYYKEYVGTRKPSDKVLVEIGDFFREAGQTDEAFKWYQRVDDRGEWGKEAAGRIWEIEVERQAKEFGWLRRQEAIPEQARELVAKGKRLTTRRNPQEARRLFEEALAIAPEFSAAYLELGDLLRSERNIEAAELAYLRALAFDSGNADIYFRLGELHLSNEPHGDFAKAALYLSRALEIRPDWTAAHLPLARALRGAGDLDGALRNLEIFLKHSPKGANRREALGLRRTIQKLVSENARRTAPEDREHPPGRALSADLVEALTRARAHLSKGRPDAAMAELTRLPEQEKGPLVLNLEARILHASGRLKEASVRLTRSLKLNRQQPEVYEQLGIIFYELGQRKRARQRFEKAASLGAGVAEYYLARLDAEYDRDIGFLPMDDLLGMDRLFAARERLGRFLKEHAGSVYAEEARLLESDIETRLWSVFGVLAALFLVLAVALALIARRLFGGVGLATLLRRFPDAGPEVQRVLSAIRHEVLKHNTLALGGVMESIERGGADAAEKARHFRRVLLGDGENEAVEQRLEKYATELGKIGRSYGVRLNLRRREPAIALLYRGFGVLKDLLGPLQDLSRLNRRGRGKLLERLKQAYHLLNVEGYEAVQQMLGQIRVLRVDEGLVRGVIVRVLREPALADVDVAPLDIGGRGLPCGVLISQRAFEDIFTNLLRNAVQSSRSAGLSPVEIGLDIDLEIDDVTGIERVVFLVKDRSPETLTTEMIRGQAIEGGLGITSDLVTRYDGTVDVVAGEGGWEKAVRVKLPLAAEERGDQ